ncbi:MAG: serine hydrolase domain-containing protein [Acidimicrobiales bacterium]
MASCASSSVHASAGSPVPPICGVCDRRFEPVREAFAANFTERGEHGAAICVMISGQVVADLYGGWADATGRLPWQPDTLVNVFSIGKGLTAACVARLAGQGRLNMETPVATYWPEFAMAEKSAISVEQLLSHQAGLPAIRHRMPPGSMLHPELMAAALAAQEPWWEPGTAHGYHANTFGFLIGELVRRSCGTTVGRVLAEEIAGPLGADVYIGLPASCEARVAEFLWPGPSPPEVEPEGLSDARLMEHNAYFNPGGLSGAGVVNTRAWRATEMPSANGHGSARGVARVYAALAAGGVLDGARVVDRSALASAVAERVYGHDLVLKRPSRFGLGFQLTQPERPLGPGPHGFGHFGAGGSLGFCDPDTGVALGYVMNEMGTHWQSPRNRALIDAVYASLQ